MKRIVLLISILILCEFVFSQTYKEKHANIITEKIIANKQEIINKLGISQDSIIFLSFWDFDGTIMKGDCSEGMTVNDTLVYKGIAQLAIESNYSKIYQPKGGVDIFFNDYRHMDDIGSWLAYPYIIQMLYGTSFKDIYYLSNKHFNDVLSKYYFKSSMQIINALENNDIQCHIISASPDVFVKGAAQSIGFDKERFNGIEVEIENEKLTEKIIYPITWANGKVEKLKYIPEKIKKQNPNKKLIILAAFGNSYTTDGPFLKYVATQQFSIAKPISVMINGGKTPKEYENLFIEVNQSEIIGSVNNKK
ncbi:MAG: haloacid dehalogenase-like hydrolase [Bacteroidales bacterium]|nr:haloacid dehalogenase-like hydrolase [Bacteroidales bacterium]MBN2755602.1 haloacid dehalogenase-like hydrolase [Bacteroidales bacterium]